MPHYEWRGADPFHDNRNGRVIGPGETVDIDDAIAKSQPEFVAVAETAADDADRPFDPTEYTVPELRDELDGGEYTDAEIDALVAAEQAGDDRSTALDAFDAARE